MYGQADDKRLAEIQKASKKEVTDTKWISGGGIGLDLAQLLLINPQIGAGQNRIGIGGLVNVFGNYKSGKFGWDNIGSLQLSIQKIGIDNPFQKSLDVLKYDTKGTYQISGKWNAGILGSLRSQLTPTYANGLLGPVLSGESGNIVSKFLAPGIIEIAPGIEYKHSEHFSVFFSPLNYKLITISDQNVANLSKGAFGTDPVDPNNPDGAYKKSKSFLGAGINANYNNKFLKEKLIYATTLKLFSNYKKEPQNIDVDWQHDLGVALFKNVTINVLVSLYYDHDILVQVDRNKDNIYDPTERGRRLSTTEALLVKYHFLF